MVNITFYIILINLNSCMSLVDTTLDSSVLEYKIPLKCQPHEKRDHLCLTPCCSLSVSDCVCHIVDAQKIVLELNPMKQGIEQE